jgi:Leucine-rich repeat (LRR) protein
MASVGGAVVSAALKIKRKKGKKGKSKKVKEDPRFVDALENPSVPSLRQAAEVVCVVPLWKRLGASSPVKAQFSDVSNMCDVLLSNYRLANKPQMNGPVLIIQEKCKIVDIVSYMSWAQKLLVTLGHQCGNLVAKMAEYKDAVFGSLVAKELEIIICEELESVKELLAEIESDEILQKGPALRLSCPEAAALWCNATGNVDSVKRSTFEDYLASILEHGELLAIPITVTAATARVIASGVCEKLNPTMISIDDILSWLLDKTLSEKLHGCLAEVNPNYAALRRIFVTADGDNWGRHDAWAASEDLFNWYGVELGDGERGSLVTLNLGHNRLEGFIPDEIGNLDTLQKLMLQCNSLSGPLPPSIGGLKQLTRLTLNHNFVSGEIPVEICGLRCLAHLSMQRNRFVGCIPEDIVNLEQLECLCLDDNQLTGPLPPGLGRLKKLAMLSVSQNKLGGIIPESIGGCIGLRVLEIHKNKIEGCIPDAIGHCLKLEVLSVSFNQLTGLVPEPIGKCCHLKEFYANENLISGRLPPSIGYLQDLESLYLQVNKLSQDIPRAIGQCRSLVNLQMWSNQLTGNIPDSLGKLKKLEVLQLQSNALEGRQEIQLLLREKLGNQLKTIIV